MPFQGETLAAIADPQVGDRFTEMCSWWLYVVMRAPGIVATVETTAHPCTLPQDGGFKVQTLAKFRGWLSYDGIPGSWVRLAGRGHDVEGWYEYWVQRELEETKVEEAQTRE